MPIQKLAKAGAMGVGSDLWILPNPEASPWARKIDWYLNFQMARATHHIARKLPVELQNLLTENEISLNLPQPSCDNLMVATQARLPAQQVVLVPFNVNKSEWLKNCHRIWKSLGAPRLRLFLPLELNDSEILNLWNSYEPSISQSIDITFVPGDLPLEA